MKTNSICYGQVRFNGHVQEHYATNNGDARTRAKELRAIGFSPVMVQSIGSQVTSVGIVAMTTVTAYGDLDKLPEVRIERI